MSTRSQSLASLAESRAAPYRVNQAELSYHAYLSTRQHGNTNKGGHAAGGRLHPIALEWEGIRELSTPDTDPIRSKRPAVASISTVCEDGDPMCIKKSNLNRVTTTIYIYTGK